MPIHEHYLKYVSSLVTCNYYNSSQCNSPHYKLRSITSIYLQCWAVPQ